MARSVKVPATRAATLADVGRAAGVSAMAASTVLNGARTSSRISPATRERIMEAAAKLRYRPNAAARALAHRRMNTIGVAVVIEGGGAGGELNTYFLEIFNGVLEAAARRDQNTTVFALHNWDRDAYRLPGFCDGRVDGMLLIAPLIPPSLIASLPTHTPFVSVHSNATLPVALNLESDEETGAYEMVKHLISLGHKRILHLTGPHGLLGAERRVRGYKRALTGARLRVDPALLIETGFEHSVARTIMRDWLRTHAGQPLPDAIFGANDGVALGCLEALSEIGLRVPQDVTLVGFDDTLSARTAIPQLASVRQPLRTMGGRAVDELLQRIQFHLDGQEPPAGPTIVFPTELVLRASIGLPHATPRLVPAC